MERLFTCKFQEIAIFVPVMPHVKKCIKIPKNTSVAVFIFWEKYICEK